MCKVWVLTSEYNDYDQHGEYLEGIWFKEPTRDEIVSVLECDYFIAEHILKGGGRRGWEHVWYYLNVYEDEYAD